MVTKTVETLKALGDEVLIFAPSGGRKSCLGRKSSACRRFRSPFIRKLRNCSAAGFHAEALEAFRPDVLLFTYFEPSLLGVVAGMLLYGKLSFDRPRIVISYHTNLPAYLHYYKAGLFAVPRGS